MQIDCPWCGSRDLREFTYMGDASRKIPRLSDSEDTWATYVYERPNPRGPWYRSGRRGWAAGAYQGRLRGRFRRMDTAGPSRQPARRSARPFAALRCLRAGRNRARCDMAVRRGRQGAIPYL